MLSKAFDEVFFGAGKMFVFFVFGTGVKVRALSRHHGNYKVP